MSYYINFLTGSNEASFNEGEYHTVEAAVAEALEMWWEGSEEPFLFWVREDCTNRIRATLTSNCPEHDVHDYPYGEVSVTVLTDEGKYEHRLYDVRYVKDSKTEVKRLA